MRIGLVLPGNIWFCPYVRNYTRILDGHAIEYDIISWNRDGSEAEVKCQFNKPQDNSLSKLAKLIPFLEYFKFIKNTIKQNQYDKLIVFGPHVGIFLSKFLNKYYKDNYIFDYRDLSIEQYKVFSYPFKKLLDGSVANVISSPGFKRCLPDRKYYISHNFNADVVRSTIGHRRSTGFNVENGIDVLTIGGIRDYDANKSVIDSLANLDGVRLRFIGKGPSADALETYCREKDIKNVMFQGFYQKEEEEGFILSSTYLNIFYPRIITHDTALSNRFYNSLIHRKPMIVTKNTTQGDYAYKYGLGLVVDNCNNLSERLYSFVKENDYEMYAHRCDALLNIFLKDQKEFEDMVKNFIK